MAETDSNTMKTEAEAAQKVEVTVEEKPVEVIEANGNEKVAEAEVEKEVTEETKAEKPTERKGAGTGPSKNILSDPSVLPESDDPEEIRKQVYTFSSW